MYICSYLYISAVVIGNSIIYCGRRKCVLELSDGGAGVFFYFQLANGPPLLHDELLDTRSPTDEATVAEKTHSQQSIRCITTIHFPIFFSMILELEPCARQTHFAINIFSHRNSNCCSNLKYLLPGCGLFSYLVPYHYHDVLPTTCVTL